MEPEKTGSGMQDQAEGLAFSRRRATGELGAGGVDKKFGGSHVIASAFSVWKLLRRESG